MTVTGDEVAGARQVEQTDDPVDVQPTAILALTAILAGIAVAALSVHRQRVLGGLVAGAVTVLMLVANQLTVTSWLGNRIDREFADELPAGTTAGDLVRTRYGFWLALLLAVAVTGYNGIEYLSERRRARPGALPPPCRSARRQDHRAADGFLRDD